MIRGKTKLGFATKLLFGWLGGGSNVYDSVKPNNKSSSISSFSTIKSLTESFMEKGFIKSPVFEMLLF